MARYLGQKLTATVRWPIMTGLGIGDQCGEKAKARIADWRMVK